MGNYKRKRSRQQTVGCQCCSILKNNSATRTKPKDRAEDERVPPQFHGGSRRKVARPYAIESRWRSWQDRTKWGLWSTYNRYRTDRERDKALSNLQRKHSYAEYRAAS